MAWPMVAAAGINAISGVASFGGSALSARKQYQRQLALQIQAQQWMEHMSSTAHQREVKDLRAAGLNPILSATGGNGASTPSSSAGNAPVSNPIGDGINTAMAVKQLKNETDLKKSSVDLNESQQGVNQTVKQLNRSLERKALYEGDAAHAQGWYQTELTRQLEDYGPLKFQAEINSILANTAKTYQDMKNSTALIQSQIEANTANAYYNRNRALGYSTSESKNYGGNLGVSRPNSDKNTKKRGYSVNLGGNYGYSSSQSW